MNVTIRCKKEYQEEVQDLLDRSDAELAVRCETEAYNKLVDRLGELATDLGWMVINKMCPREAK